MGWKSKKVIKRIKKSKFLKDIILTGYISENEKEYFFKNCVAFIYPSIYEGFGIPVLEAMQEEAIVITSNISSIPEVGGDAPYYLKNIYDENELATIIEKVCNISANEKDKKIELGIIQTKKFTWKICAKQIMEELINVGGHNK